jgi:hypothetical protein
MTKSEKKEGRFTNILNTFRTFFKRSSNPPQQTNTYKINNENQKNTTPKILNQLSTQWHMDKEPQPLIFISEEERNIQNTINNCIKEKSKTPYYFKSDDPDIYRKECIDEFNKLKTNALQTKKKKRGGNRNKYNKTKTNKKKKTKKNKKKKKN